MYFQGSRNELERLLSKSCTLYIGNLSFYTTDLQIYELFSKCGDVKRVIVGLDRFKKTPCGFCFVEYPFIYIWICMYFNIGIMKLQKYLRKFWIVLYCYCNLCVHRYVFLLIYVIDNISIYISVSKLIFSLKLLNFMVHLYV